MLVDCGGKTPYRDNGERIIAPYLFRKKIKRIDYLVLTHPQSDHIGGLNYLLDHFSIGEVWIPDIKEKFTDLEGRNIKIVKWHSDNYTNIDNVSFMFFNPANDESVSVNDSSLVFSLVYGKTSFLFTGDIEEETESKLSLRSIKSAVLKVPHHGSCTSSSEKFLNAVSPEIAVISAGRNNPFRHPCSKAVERLKKHTKVILATPIDGSIFIESDGEMVCYTTYYNKGNSSCSENSP